MASKRSRIVPPRTVAPATSRVGTAAGSNGVAPSAAVAPPRPGLRPAGRNLMRWVGSLQVAVIVLPLFAFVLFLGTLLESWHDRRTAHLLIYRTWWFGLLLGLLGANVLFAALMKWPWKKHQTGFLITHLGLITLVVSGVLTAMFGSTGVLVMVDSPEPQFRTFGRHKTDFVIDRDRQVLRVLRNGTEILRGDFEPGPFAWPAAEQSRANTLTRCLGWLAHPLPRSWSRDLGGEARLEVIGFHPHTREQPFAPASANAAESFPAVEFQLASPGTGLLAPQWVAYQDGKRALAVGPGVVEFLGRDLRPEQLAEFEKPVADSKMGQLVLGLHGKTYRLGVAELVDQPPQPLEESGWNIRLLQYLPNFADVRDRKPRDPAVSVELSRPDGIRTSFALPARRGGQVFPLKGSAQLPGALQDLWAWYHPPTARHGDESLLALLQFATGSDGRLHYRSFSGATSAFAFESASVVAKDGDWRPLWGKMQFKLRVTEFMPHAASGPHYIPLDSPPASEEQALPALRCRLTNRGETVEFQVVKTDGGLTGVSAGGEHFQVGYNSTLRDLGFELTLLKAEQTTDPGSNLPASETSTVRLQDAERGVDEQHRITFNEPLEHRGLKIYQTSHAKIGTDANGQEVHRAMLTVTHDPGLYPKYAGSAMVALGIACMFYMRAYFFKRRPSGE
jgi:ResB-like family protein